MLHTGADKLGSGWPASRSRGGPIIASIALLLLALATSATAEDVKIGYVDQKRLLDTAPQVTTAREALDREFRPRNETLLADEARLDRMQRELAASEDLEAEQRFDVEREIRNLQRSIERRREDMTEELRFRINAEKNALEETIDVAVRHVAREGGYDLILTSPVAFASESIDITDRVLQWLEEDFDNQRNRESR